MSVIIWIIQNILLQWYVTLPAAALLIFLAFRNFRVADTHKPIDSILLSLDIPRANDKKELAAEQLFASLHGILRDAAELKRNNNLQEYISFEIASVNGQIRFYVWVPQGLRSFVESQIYAQYPTVQINAADEDYVSHERDHSVIHTAEITLEDSEFLPIKTFQSFEVDPLAGITGALARLEDTGEEIWVQVLARPTADEWHKASSRWVERMKTGSVFFTSGEGGGGALQWFGMLLEALWRPPEQGAAGAPSTAELSDRDKTRISEAQAKATKLGYQVKIRLAYLGDNQQNAKLQMQAITGSFKQFNSTNLNGFKVTNQSFRKEDLAAYKQRSFVDRGFILNIEELASVFHLPHTSVETPNIVWASSKTAEPPSNLPVLTGDPAYDENISAFGLTNFRGVTHQFGLTRFDRSRHVYIIGQTGAGKSGTLELLTLSDIYHNQGYAIIDPHGDFAVDNLKFIPESRIQDVIYFNPADTQYPLGFNPLEMTHPEQKTNISSEVIGVLKRMFGESWGPRLEYILRYTLLALLDRPETTMLDITRMLTDKNFRKETLSYCQDTVVLQFWNAEFNSWTERFQNEAIAPVLNKVGAFTANPIIRNIIGQPKSTFDIRQIMDEGKILIVNLSKGLIGEDNASILGSFLVTKVQLAAMSRSDIERIEDRRPFYLYVDEFQNFATDSFASILSEARKYGLNLTVANQYVSQMSDTVRDAVFGNVGTMISFRVSPDDAPILAQQFEPQFESLDLLQMHNRHFIVNMVINGEKAPAFSATTLTLPQAPNNHINRIVENTRRLYSRTRADIEVEIAEAIAPPKKLKPQSQTPAKPRQANTQTPQPQPQSSTPEATPESEPRKKRTRSRRRRKPESDADTATPQARSTPAAANERRETPKRQPSPKPAEDKPPQSTPVRRPSQPKKQPQASQEPKLSPKADATTKETKLTLR